MALRLDDATFGWLAQEELSRWRADESWATVAMGVTVLVDDHPAAAPMAHLSGEGAIVLHKKPVLALVDTESAAREIARNLIRWGLEEIEKGRR